jgi:hypothetical protein
MPHLQDDSRIRVIIDTDKKCSEPRSTVLRTTTKTAEKVAHEAAQAAAQDGAGVGLLLKPQDLEPVPAALNSSSFYNFRRTSTAAPGRLFTRDELLQLIEADLGRPVLPRRLQLILAAFTRPAAAGDGAARNIDLPALLLYGFDDFLTDTASHRFRAGEAVVMSSRDKGSPTTVVTIDYRGPVTVVGGGLKTFDEHADQRGEVVSGWSGGWLTVAFEDGETDEFMTRKLRLPKDKQSLGKHHPLARPFSLLSVSLTHPHRLLPPPTQASSAPSPPAPDTGGSKAGSSTPSWPSAMAASARLSWSTWASLPRGWYRPPDAPSTPRSYRSGARSQRPWPNASGRTLAGTGGRRRS